VNREEKRAKKFRAKEERSKLERGFRDITRLLWWIFIVGVLIAVVLYVTFLQEALEALRG